jgi:peptide deformylase
MVTIVSIKLRNVETRESNWKSDGDIFEIIDHEFDHLCGLVVRVPGYSSGSIPNATRFSEK